MVGLGLGIGLQSMSGGGSPALPSVSFLSNAVFADTANDYRVHTFSSMDTSGHTAGDDVFVTFTLRNATNGAQPESITVGGQSASLVSGTDSSGPNLFLTHSSIWRITEASALGASADVVVTLPSGAGMNGGAVGLYSARNVASVTGYASSPVLSSSTSSTTLSLSVAEGAAVIAAGGQRNISTLDFTGVSRDFVSSLIAAGNRLAAAGSASALEASGSYDVVLLHPSAAGASLSAVTLNPS